MYSATIINAETLNENVNNPDWVILDCRSSLTDNEAGHKAYLQGHIENAQYCYLNDDFSSPITQETGRHPLPDFDQLITKLGNWGVDKNTQVIVYDDVNGAFAVRMWWQLRAFGHPYVAVLNGGLTQWRALDFPLTKAIPDPTKKTFLVDPSYASSNYKRLMNKYVVTTEEIQKNLIDKRFSLLDARTTERYKGEAEPIDTVAGRIPDALNRAFQLNLDENGLFLSAEELKQQFDPIISHANQQQLVHMCGSGVTACHNMLAMEIAGFAQTKLYVGSWSEWIRDSDRPIVNG